MSLYDKYFSLQNKQHVYSVISNLVYQDTGELILHNETYISLYKYHYPRIFDETNTDNLTTLNKALVDQVGELILWAIMRKQTQVKPKLPRPSSLSTISESSSTSIASEKCEVLDIYSCDRIIGSTNRYDYIVEIHDKQLRLDEITLPKESNPIFALPVIQIHLCEGDVTLKLICRLVGTRNVGGKEFIKYTCDSNETISVKSSLHIRILNHRGDTTLQGSDEIPVKKHKRIKYKNLPYTCFAIKSYSQPIQKDDIIGIYHHESCSHTGSVCEYDNRFVLIEPTVITQPVTHLLNISYQNHLKFETNA